MRHLLHFLILDGDRRRALAIRSAAGWLFPSAACATGMRLGPVVSRVLGGLGLTGDGVGQWNARVTPDGGSIDTLVITVARPKAGRCGMDHDWIVVGDLLALPALVEYQAWALRRTFGDRTADVTGPFEMLNWFSSVAEWMRGLVGSFEGVTIHRATEWEVVLGISEGSRRWYFKGLTRERAIEAHLTMSLAMMCPASFAPTVAIESGPNGTTRWLMESWPGVPLSARLTDASIAHAAAECVRMQERIGDVRCLRPALPRLDAVALTRWSWDIVDPSRDRQATDAIDRAVDDVVAAGFADRWLPLDLDPANILLDDQDRVAVIDLDDSFVGPAPLAAATLVRRVRARARRGATASGADVVRVAYERMSQRPMTPRLWKALDTLAVVIEARLACQRLETARARGALQGPVDILVDRIRTSLVRTVSSTDHFGSSW